MCYMLDTNYVGRSNLALQKEIYIYIYLCTTIFAEVLFQKSVNKCIFHGFTMHKHLFDMSGNKNPCHCSSALSTQVSIVVADSKRI